MRYSGYPEYTTTDKGLAHPKEWSAERLRFSILSNPVKSEVADWEDDTLVSFVPMEAVGEYGGVDLSKEKPIGDVYAGYTYFADGDIVIAKITPCFENGKGAIAEGLKNGVAFGTTEFHVVRPLNGISKRWLFYLTISDAFRNIGASEMLGAGGQKRVPETFIKDFRIGIPSSTEQQKIADFLDWKTGQIDELVSQKKLLIEALKEKRIALITKAVTKGLKLDVPMRDSGIPWIGEVPKHWKVIRLRFLLSERFANGLFKKADFWGEGYRIVNVTDLYIHNDLIEEDDLGRLECTEDELKTYSANHGDFFIVRSSLKLEGVGKSAALLNPSEPAVFECHIVRGRPNLEEIHPRFLNLFMNSYYARKYFMTQANVVTMATIDQERIKNLVVALPSYIDQKQIADSVDEMSAYIDALINKNEDLIEKLTEYRTALITAATTGKIDVRNVKIGGAA